MQTLAEKLRIILACFEGKGTVQYQDSQGYWRDSTFNKDTTDITFTFNKDAEIRLKPVPEYIWRNIYKYGDKSENDMSTQHSYYKSAKAARSGASGPYYVRTERFVKEE